MQPIPTAFFRLEVNDVWIEMPANEPWHFASVTLLEKFHIDAICEQNPLH